MMQRILTFTLAMLFFVQVLVFLPMASQAYAAVDSACDKSSSFLSIPTWYKYLDVQMKNGSCTVVVPTIKDADGSTKVNVVSLLSKVALAIVEIALYVAGLVAVGFIIFGGFKFILSNGEPDRAAGARTTIINALVGLMIAILATGIVSFLGSNIK